MGGNLLEVLEEWSSAKRLHSFWHWGTRYDWLIRMLDNRCWSKSFNFLLTFFFHFNSWRRSNQATVGFLHLGSVRNEVDSVHLLPSNAILLPWSVINAETSCWWNGGSRVAGWPVPMVVWTSDSDLAREQGNQTGKLEVFSLEILVSGPPESSASRQYRVFLVVVVFTCLPTAIDLSESLNPKTVVWPDLVIPNSSGKSSMSQGPTCVSARFLSYQMP